MAQHNLQIDADTAAAYLKKAELTTLMLPESEQLRDFLDAWTQGELDCLKLDILTEMVSARLKHD